MEGFKNFFTAENLISLSIKLAIAVAVLIAGIFVIKLIVAVIKKIFKKTNYDGAAGNLISQIIKALLVIVLLLIFLSLLGVKITNVVALISAATVALGIALQGSLSNLASGIILASTKPFKEGQFVEINGVSGTVKTINFFTTEMMTLDNKKIIIPNSQITASSVINFNDQELRMINQIISISYQSELELAQSVLLSVMKGHESVLEVPEPTARLEQFGASSIDINIRAWTKTSVYKSVFWDINEEIYRQFKANGIVIPYQQIDISIKEVSEAQNLIKKINDEKKN